MTEEPDLQEDLYEHHKFVVDRGQSLFRIDKYLTNKIENISRNKIQNAARAGNIRVNGIAVKPNYRVKPLDTISILLPEPPRDTEIIPENIPLEVVYEDTSILVINKKAGMVVHPAYANYTGTLVNALYYKFSGIVNSDSSTVLPYLVHRIDKDTSGIMLVAKTEYAQSCLAKQFFEHTISRVYIALVWGDLPQDEGTISGYINRSPKDRRVMWIYDEETEGRHSVTHYKVIERFGYVTLVECRLETGRTHQIRAHFRHIGHPLFSDESYGGRAILKGTLFAKYKQFVENCFTIMPRQALHAKSLGFLHPDNDVFMNFDSELPPDFEAVLSKWRTYTRTKATDNTSISEDQD
jgi:23S rRNA pseudouridine1911/1915/1917 synthase